jgi:hypothetical protein
MKVRTVPTSLRLDRQRASLSRRPPAGQFGPVGEVCAGARIGLKTALRASWPGTPTPAKPGRSAGKTAASSPTPPGSRAVRSSLRSGTPVAPRRPTGALDPSTAGPLRRPPSPQAGEDHAAPPAERQVSPLEP